MTYVIFVMIDSIYFTFSIEQVGKQTLIYLLIFVHFYRSIIVLAFNNCFKGEYVIRFTMNNDSDLFRIFS